MKNKWIYFSFLLFFTFKLSIAQEENLYVEYLDQQIYRKETTAILKTNNQSAIYIEKQSKEKSSKSSSAISGTNTVALIHEVEANQFHKSKDNQIIYYKEFINDIDTVFLVYDVLPKMNWERIENETKTILGYVCKKAKVKFRGTNLTAYYTEEIPYSFGPWKFDGLPGLILEISADEDPRINWTATKVIFPYTEKVDYIFEKEDYNLSLKTFNFKSFAITESRIPNNSSYNASQRLKYGKRIFVVEKIYEWEKQNDVWRVYFASYFKKPALW